MHRIRGKLTYANVMATIAVFIALGGASYAAVKLPKNSVGSEQIKNGAITGAKIKNGAVTGAKIDLAGLGQVPSAGTATSATNAAHAATATEATHAASADSASSLAAPEPVHVVTEFENAFHNLGEGFEKAGYYRDRQCEVHLQGTITGDPGRVAFNLPEGFRPPGDIWAAAPTGSIPGYLEVLADGSVRVGVYEGANAERSWALDGMTFRVAGC